MSVRLCGICSCELDTADPLSRDCGGDCLKCMGLVAKDPDCVEEVMFRSGFRLGSRCEGGKFEFDDLQMYIAESLAWEKVQSGDLSDL